MKRFGILLFTAMLIMGIATSCEEVEPTPDSPNTENPDEEKPEEEKPEPDELAKNSFAINGTEYTFGSVAVMMEGEYPLIVATPTEGVESAEGIFECEEYFYGAVSPLLVGVECDVMSEKRLYTFVSTLVGAELETVAPEFLEEVSTGSFLMSKNGDVFTLKASLTLADGTTLEVHIEAEENFVVNENKIWRGEEEKPLRAVFYKTDENTTSLYFTPAGIDYFEELEVALWYLYIVVDDALVGGEVVNVANIDAGTFRFGMVDNHSQESVEISAEDMQGATGTFRLLKGDEEGHYTAEVNITVGGVTYKIAYDGNCTWWEEAPEVKTNYMIYNKKEQALTLAVIDTSSDVWSVEIGSADGSVVTATVPAELFNGSACGFSWSADLAVSYLGETYSKATGYGGTITASYDEARSMLNFDFTNYSNLEVHYAGSCIRK